MINFKNYRKIAADLNSAANSLWNRTAFITPAEILEGGIDLKQLDEICWNLKDELTKTKRALTSEVDSVPEEEYFEKYEKDHNEVDDLFYKVDDKLDLIDFIIYTLKSIDDKSEEDDNKNLFQDMPRIDLSESIRLLRFV